MIQKPSGPVPLDSLLSAIRHDPSNLRSAPVAAIVNQLGLSTRQRQSLLRAGIGVCCLGALAAALVAGGVSKRERLAAPPALTLITHGSGPLASL